MNNNHLRAEVETLIKELQLISKSAKSQTSRILHKNAKPIIDALFLAAPHGKKIHKRYKSAGLSRRIRAGRGKGTVVAIYRPGNLATSFRVFRFKNARFNIVVGAKIQKGQPTGAFGPGTGRSDAYYAGMIEGGGRYNHARPFVKPTWARLREPTRQAVIADLQKLIKRIKK